MADSPTYWCTHCYAAVLPHGSYFKCRGCQQGYHQQDAESTPATPQGLPALCIRNSKENSGRNFPKKIPATGRDKSQHQL